MSQRASQAINDEDEVIPDAGEQFSGI